MKVRLLAISTVGFVLSGCTQDDGRPGWGQPWDPGGAAGADDDGFAEETGDDDDASDEDTTGDPTGAPPDPSTTAPGTTDPTAPTGASSTDPTGLTAGGETTTGAGLPPESPYAGGWDIGTCQDSVSSSVPDATLTDQNGDSVRLYDFCHKAILLVGGAFW